MSKVLDDAKALVGEIEAAEAMPVNSDSKTVSFITVTYTDGTSETFSSPTEVAGAPITQPDEPTPPTAGGSGTPVDTPSADGSATSSDSESQDVPSKTGADAGTVSTGGAGADAGVTPTA